MAHSSSHSQLNHISVNDNTLIGAYTSPPRSGNPSGSSSVSYLNYSYGEQSTDYPLSPASGDRVTTDLQSLNQTQVYENYGNPHCSASSPPVDVVQYGDNLNYRASQAPLNGAQHGSHPSILPSNSYHLAQNTAGCASQTDSLAFNGLNQNYIIWPQAQQQLVDLTSAPQSDGQNSYMNYPGVFSDVVAIPVHGRGGNFWNAEQQQQHLYGTQQQSGASAAVGQQNNHQTAQHDTPYVPKYMDLSDITTTNPKHLELYQFLFCLLHLEDVENCIAWTDDAGEFIFKEGDDVARLWRIYKNSRQMNYDLMTRAIRGYYPKKDKIVKGSKNFRFRFVNCPKLRGHPEFLDQLEHIQQFLRELR